MKYAMVWGLALALIGCSEPAVTEVAAEPTAEVALPPDDGLGAEPEDYVANIQGRFQLWQNDRGEDGEMCALELLGTRSIGGYGVESDTACLANIGIEDISAWFFAEEDGDLVLVDATRKAVMRLKRDEAGYYYFGDSDFYLSRAGTE